MQTMTVKVAGMTCGGCEQSVSRALRELPGVETVEAAHRTGEVTLTGAELPDREALRAAVEDAGYELVPEGGKPLPMLGG